MHFFSNMHFFSAEIILICNRRVKWKWKLVSGKEENGRTVLKFSRTFLSCDEEYNLDVLVSIRSLFLFFGKFGL